MFCISSDSFLCYPLSGLWYGRGDIARYRAGFLSAGFTTLPRVQGRATHFSGSEQVVKSSLRALGYGLLDALAIDLIFQDDRFTNKLKTDTKSAVKAG